MKRLSVFILVAVVTLTYIWKPLALAVGFSIWFALSFILVGLAYYKNWAMLFRKSENGAIPQSIRWMFFPFLVCTHFYNGFIRLRDPMPSIHRISDELFQGARLRRGELEVLEDECIDSVLDLTAEFDGLGSFADYDSELNYLNIPVLDHMVPTYDQINHACSWIEEQHKANRSVLVHCALGRGRASFMVAAYLLHRRNVSTVEEAIKHISSIRKKARLNKRQTKALASWFADQKDFITQRKSMAIIANPVSGGGKWQAVKEDILNTLSPHFEISVYTTSVEIGAKEQAEVAVNSGAEVLLACGGDGTLNEVATIAITHDLPLAIMPLGTANALAHVLFGWESKVFPVHAACSAIIQGHTKRVDTAICNDELMLVAAGIGIEEHMIRYAHREAKNDFGQFAYLQGFVNGLSEHAEQELSVQLDDAPAFSVLTRSLVVANAAPSTTVLAQGCGAPNFKDGLLDLTWFTERANEYASIAAVGSLAMAAVVDEVNSDAVAHKRAANIHIKSQELINYVVDGEVRTAKELSIQVKPKSLLLYMPDEGRGPSSDVS